MSKVADFLPPARGKTIAVQGEIPADLHAEVKKAMKADPREPGFTDLIVAAMHLYLEERRGKR